MVRAFSGEKDLVKTDLCRLDSLCDHACVKCEHCNAWSGLDATTVPFSFTACQSRSLTLKVAFPQLHFLFLVICSGQCCFLCSEQYTLCNERQNDSGFCWFRTELAAQGGTSNCQRRGLGLIDPSQKTRSPSTVRRFQKDRRDRN